MITGYGDKAIWSPTTSVADNQIVIHSLLKELNGYQNVRVSFDHGKHFDISQSMNSDWVVFSTSKGSYETKYFINAAG